MNGDMGRDLEQRLARAGKAGDKFDKRAKSRRRAPPKNPPVLKALPNHITVAFDMMGIADEEIAAAKAEDPEHAQLYDAAFGKLYPPEGFRGLAPAVYRYHARELVRRAGLGKNVTRATNAEVMVALMNTSLKAPLQRDAQALYEDLFEQCFGREQALELLGPTRATFSHPMARTELFHEFEARLSRTTGR